MDTVRIASDELSLGLSKSLELIRALTVLSREKETNLQTGDIENLRAATDREEELIADLGRLEKDRETHAGALAEAIGFFGSRKTLSELIEGIEDTEIRRHLTGLKEELSAAVNALTAQNEKLRQLLTLQIDFTEYMLNLIYTPKSVNTTYDVQGSRTDEESRTSLFDLHV